MNRYYHKAMGLMNSCPCTIKASSPSKIALNPKCSFDLPPGPNFSCPGATKACEQCYAAKKRSLFNNVIKRKLSNWRGIKKLGQNVDRISSRLGGVVPQNAKIYRIHSSGDFYSQAYIDAWYEVIHARHNTEFWAFTRSFGFNYQKLVRLPNFNLLASTDEYNAKQAQQFVRRYAKSHVRHAYGPWEHNKPLPPNSFVCPVTSKAMKTDGACEHCRLCINKGIKKHVVFYRH